MSDIEITKAMFDRAGIKYVIEPIIGSSDFILSVESGYFGFVSEFHFKADGSLFSLGAYE